MSAPGQSTFDGNPNLATPTTIGYRPGQDDFNGAACEDDAASPPDPKTMPTAPCWNTFAMQLVSVGKAMACAGVSVHAGGTLASYWTAANKMVTNPFTITKTGTGKVQITWPANTFPISGWPKAYLNDASGTAASITAFNITNGIEIHTYLAGALADADCQVDLF